MGSSLSRFRLALQSFRAISAAYEELNKRIEESPGIPHAAPSTPYWAIPASPLGQHNADATLPPYADVVIVGSGITGAAFARTLVGLTSKDSDKSPQIVMLEARDACSGATARNGGHVTPLLYHDYDSLKKEHGVEMAKKILKFRMAHLEELLRVSEEDDILGDCQCRRVETFDVFFDQETFDSTVKTLTVYLDEMPEQRKLWRILDAEECVKDLQMSQTVVGAIGTPAGSIHPYRFVTGILSRLLSSHPTSFRLFTHTPCLSISSTASSKSDEQLYTVSTSKGTIRARHVVHATNAWASHLLPAMRRKIIPVRGHMSAQRPGLGLGRAAASESRPPPPLPASSSDSILTLSDANADSWLGKRSFVFYSEGRYDYLTQQPVSSPYSVQSSYPPPAGELMFGGGLGHGGWTEGAAMKEVGVADDRSWSFNIGASLSGALSMYFGGWGAEGRDISDKSEHIGEETEEGRVKKLWTGILALSADSLPWVGRLPVKISGRSAPRTKSKQKSSNRLAPPGEWIAAGYNGEGMPNAYLSGKALAYMVNGNSDDMLPDAFLVTEARWKKAKVEDRFV